MLTSPGSPGRVSNARSGSISVNAGGIGSGAGGSTDTVTGGTTGGTTAGSTVKTRALEPATLKTRTGPLIAVAGTVTTSSLTDSKVAGPVTDEPAVVNVTVVESVKFAPFNPTTLPRGAVAGEKLDRLGPGVVSGPTIVRATLQDPPTSVALQKLSCSMLRSVSLPSPTELPAALTWTVPSA